MPVSAPSLLLVALLLVVAELNPALVPLHNADLTFKYSLRRASAFAQCSRRERHICFLISDTALSVSLPKAWHRPSSTADTWIRPNY